MLKQNVTYKNLFTDEEVTETLYFNLSKAEIINLMLEEDDYLANLQTIGKDSEVKELLKVVKDLIRRSYGIKDGDRFRKSDIIVDDFMTSEVYSTFIFDLFTDPVKTAAFVEKVMPPELIEMAKNEMAAKKPQDHLPKKKHEVVRLPNFLEEVEDRAVENEALPNEITEPPAPEDDEWAAFQEYKRTQTKATES